MSFEHYQNEIQESDKNFKEIVQKKDQEKLVKNLAFLMEKIEKNIKKNREKKKAEKNKEKSEEKLLKNESKEENEDDLFNAVVDQLLENEAKKTWKKNFPDMPK